MTTEEPSLSSQERAALDALVPPEQQTGDVRDDLIAAVRESWRRREENTKLGAAVLGALYRSAQSWRTIEFITGVPRTTARRWATPPAEADADRPNEPDDDSPEQPSPSR
jgi:hypothetical protein